MTHEDIVESGMAQPPQPPTTRRSPESDVDTPTLVFPQVAQLELEELLTQLVDRAQEVLRTQGRLRALLRATQTVATDLSLPVVLRHIVDAARELVNARYAALGVFGPDRQLAQFIHVGVGPATAEGIGQLPEGRGVLGVLIEEAHTVRLPDLTQDTRSVGLPPAHPAMRSFLGVPVRSRGEVFGNLYLTDKETGGEFTAEDEELVRALAAAAAVAIDKARLFEETSMRQRWQEMSVETTAALLSGLDADDGLDIVIRQARRLADADAGLIALLTPDGPQTIRIAAASGSHVADLLNREEEFAGSLAEQAFQFGEPLSLVGDELGKRAHCPDTPYAATAVLAVPLFARERPLGVLTLGSYGPDASYDDRTVQMVAGLAAQAAVAWELAQARRYQEQLVALSGREDLIRDLNDRVVSRLFAVGLQMHGLAASLPDTEQSRRISAVVGELDLAIRDIRDAVFHLNF
jgi:GAF domain-containing protein